MKIKTHIPIEKWAKNTASITSKINKKKEITLVVINANL